MTPRKPSLRLMTLVLGPPGPKRARYLPAAVALMATMLFALFQHGEVLLGLIDERQSNLLTLCNIGGAFTFYLLIRSGLSRRIANDASLILPQSLWAMGAISWSYAITGPARGAVISIMILVLVYGMFGLRPRQVRWLALAGFSLLTAVMIWRASTVPESYPPRVELIHFLFAALVIWSTSSLSVQMGRLRASLKARKDELEVALALNRELATRDPLTGLLNRRAMGEMMAREQPRIERGQGPVSLALIDIDWFKRVNDNHGHQAGDTVLKRVAEILTQGMRSADALSRWGGEEFLLLMPDTARDAAQAAINRLRQRMAAEDLHAIAPGLRVTFSAGVVECGEREGQDAAIDRADKALYTAKENGRSRVEVA